MARYGAEELTMLFGISWNTSSDGAFAASILPILLRGMVATVQASIVGLAIALVLGLVLAVLKSSRLRAVYTELPRLSPVPR